MEIPRIGFGTSRLHHIEGSSRARLLDAAFDLGITHFDTAPAYGDTLAEIEIGKMPRNRRQALTIATKYGIPPNQAIAAIPSFRLPIRGFGAIAQKAGIWKRRRAEMTAQGLRRSVEQSLRRLRSDWIDILFLHEPEPGVLKSPEAILQELLLLQGEGHIRCFGLAGSWHGIAALGDASTAFAEIVQTAEKDWPAARPPAITYGIVSGAPQSMRKPDIASDCAFRRLKAAMERRPDGAVLVSTTDPHHLRSLAEQAALL